MSKPIQKTKQAKSFQQKKESFSGRKWLGLVLILLITFLVFYPTVNYDFVNYDDGVNVTENGNIQSLTPQSIKNIFTSTVTGGYTPLTTISFAIDYHFFGLNPKPYHAINLILHLLCTALVFLIMKNLGMSFLTTLIVTMLFGIHPMRVESVAWITERKDVLYSFFYLLAIISYIGFVISKKTIYYILTLIAFIFSLLSKIQAVTLPLILLLIDYFFTHRLNFKLVLNKIPFFLLSLVIGIAGIIFLAKDGSLDTGTIVPIYQRIFIGTYSLCVYLIKSVVPYKLSAMYPFPSELTVIHYLSFPVVLLIGYLIWKIKKYRVEIIFGTLFFFFNVMFMLQVVGAGAGFIADRFTYIAYLGLFFIFAFLIDRIAFSKWKYIVITICSLYFLVLGVISYNRVKVWNNSMTLWNDVISKYQTIPTAYNSRGFIFAMGKKYDKALADFNKAIELNPNYFEACLNRGNLFMVEGNYDKAIVDFGRAIALNSNRFEPYYNRGTVFLRKSNFDKALVDFDKAIALNPNRFEPYYNRGTIFLDEGNYDKAIGNFNKAIALKTDYAEAYYGRGWAYHYSSKKDAACKDFKQASTLGLKKATDAFLQFCR